MQSQQEEDHLASDDYGSCFSDRVRVVSVISPSPKHTAVCMIYVLHNVERESSSVYKAHNTSTS